jgi:hypothetical protein
LAESTAPSKDLAGLGRGRGFGARLQASPLFRLLPLAAALTISAFALAEIWNAVEDFELGRAHGLLSMGVVKLAYAFGELQDKASEIDQSLSVQVNGKMLADGGGSGRGGDGGGGGEAQRHSPPQSPPPLPGPQLLRRSKLSGRQVLADMRAVLMGRRTTMAACSFALGACLVEIVRDLEDEHGAKRGAALLAASELNNQWHRLSPLPTAAAALGSGGSSSSGNLGGGSGGNTGGGSSPFGSQSQRLALARRLRWRQAASGAVALAAMVVAGREVVADTWSAPVGAGHAMAVLAAAQLVENGHRALVSLGVPRPPLARVMVV